MSNITKLRHRVKWFDPGAIHLRDMVVTMAIALSCFGSGLLFKHYAHLFDDTVILSVVLAITVARSQASADRRQRIMALAVIPATAVAAGEASMLMGSHVALGDAIFVAALTTAVWIRRFGSRFAQVGTMMTLPFIAILMIPSGLTFFGALHQLWSGAVAAVAVLCAALWQLSARRIGFIQTPSGRAKPAPLRRDREKRSAKGISVSTRMALQMAAALSCAFVLGHYVFGSHWIWVVLTAYIVCSGNRGRGDVVHKSAMRVIGAACGTLVATGLSGLLPQGDATSIVLIFVVIAFAVWLRPINYAFWAFSVTAALAFLYGYFGEGGAGVLGTRLEAIFLGAAIGATATWLLLPVRSTDVLRQRENAYLGLTAAYLADLGGGEAKLNRLQSRIDQAMVSMDEVSRTLRAGNIAIGQGQNGRDVLAARSLHRCEDGVRKLAMVVRTEPDVLQVPGIAERIQSLEATITSIRRALSNQDERLDTGSQRDQSAPFEEKNEGATQALDAVRGCHCALMDFARARGLLSSDEDAKAREVLPTVGMPLEPRETAETCRQP